MICLDLEVSIDLYLFMIVSSHIAVLLLVSQLGLYATTPDLLFPQTRASHVVPAYRAVIEYVQPQLDPLQTVSFLLLWKVCVCTVRAKKRLLDRVLAH